jgi:hypothetical protein
MVISMPTQGVLVQFGQLDPQSEMEIVPLFEMLGLHHNLGIMYNGYVFDYIGIELRAYLVISQIFIFEQNLILREVPILSFSLSLFLSLRENERDFSI